MSQRRALVPLVIGLLQLEFYIFQLLFILNFCLLKLSLKLSHLKFLLLQLVGKRRNLGVFLFKKVAENSFVSFQFVDLLFVLLLQGFFLFFKLTDRFLEVICIQLELVLDADVLSDVCFILADLTFKSVEILNSIERRV